MNKPAELAGPAELADSPLAHDLPFSTYTPAASLANSLITLTSLDLTTRPRGLD